MNRGVPRHREPSGLRTARVPHRSSPFFSAASPPFPHFSSLEYSAIPLLSATCALLQKQRRGVRFLPSHFPVSRLRFPLSVLFSAACCASAGFPLSAPGHQLDRNSLRIRSYAPPQATPLECALTAGEVGAG